MSEQRLYAGEKMTLEQVAEFERRAERGEKPSHPGWVFYDRTPLSSCNEAILECCMFGVMVSHGYHGWVISGVMRHPFASMEAAQLAAEHILREWTRSLHEPEGSA